MRIRSIFICGLIVIALATMGCSRRGGYLNHLGPDGYYQPFRDYGGDVTYFDAAP